MPCRSDYPDDAAREATKIRNQLANLEALLCSACRALETKGFDFGLNPALDGWWARHKVEDAARTRRAEQEAARRRQIAKEVERLLALPLNELTPQDRDLLKKEGVL